MAENKEGQQKTEPASGKRLNEAKARGQVSKSMDVINAAVLLLGGYMTFSLGGPMLGSVSDFMKKVLHNSAFIEITPQNVTDYYGQLIIFIAKTLLPLLFVISGVILAAEISQVGFHFATKKFTQGLNWKSIFNPFGGLKNIMFSSRSAVELAKSLAKLLILGGVIYQVLDGHKDDAVSLMDKPFTEFGGFLASVCLELVMKIGMVYIAIAIGDFFFQKWKYKEDLKMTKEEVKEEMKQAEGDPKVKSRIRSLMRQRIKKLMMQNVKTADVVITNPTHFAVALKYDTQIRSSPYLVAKGVDYLALNIKELAIENNIPIVEDPPLARTIYYSVQVEQEIPENLFKVVAQILAYIYHLKKNSGYMQRQLNKIYQNS